MSVEEVKAGLGVVAENVDTIAREQMGIVANGVKDVHLEIASLQEGLEELRERVPISS